MSEPQPDHYFGAEDRETRAAVERIVSNWPIQLPHPELDGACCINAVTGVDLPTIRTFVEANDRNE
jgi:hypothetical protein